MKPKGRHVPAAKVTLTVAKRSRPVARVLLSSDKPGSLRGSVLHGHDLMSPVDAKWDVRL